MGLFQEAGWTGLADQDLWNSVSILRLAADLRFWSGQPVILKMSIRFRRFQALDFIEAGTRNLDFVHLTSGESLALGVVCANEGGTAQSAFDAASIHDYGVLHIVTMMTENRNHEILSSRTTEEIRCTHGPSSGHRVLRVVQNMLSGIGAQAAIGRGETQ